MIKNHQKLISSQEFQIRDYGSLENGHRKDERIPSLKDLIKVR